MKNKNNVNPLVHALLPIGVTFAYIIIGFLFDSGWAIGWILFLLIPIVETLINAIKTKNPSHFAYPVLVTAVFLFTGMMWGWWHPGWVMFVTIPAYYAVCDAINKQRAGKQEIVENNNQESTDGTYFQPTVEVENSNNKRNSNITSIVITAIICGTVVAVIAIVFVFSWLSGGTINVKGFDDYENTDGTIVSEQANISAEGINAIDIEWVDGNVNIEYYDDDEIHFEETSSKYPMIYKVENNTLHIDEYSTNKISSLKGFRKKDLTVKLPKDMELVKLNLEIVSSNINANDLNAKVVELDSVSGNTNLSFATQPRDIEIESVSGDINIGLPSDISGYTILKDSVSGDVNANDFGDTLYYGDGYTQIDVDSVSGNLNINKN